MFPGDRLFNGRPPFLAGVILDRTSAKYEQGELIGVTFQAEETAHLYLLYHQADGTTALLFPNVAERQTLVPARTKKQLPTPGGGFRFRVQAPFGREVLQVLAANTPLQELDTLVIAGQKQAPTVSQELLDRMAARLQYDASTWAEHRIPLETVPKPAAPRPPQRPVAPQRIALFVGIGKYQHPELAETHAELSNSAKVMHRHMLDAGKLNPDRTRLLLDEQATRGRIEESMVSWLPSVSKPGDTVFVYFSGHAAQFETTDKSEPDGKDEALCPYDLTAGRPELAIAERVAAMKKSSILDDTLARWLQELSGRQVVLILDTCHSGGVTAGKTAALAWADEESARLKDISQLNTVILASCAVDEQSLFAGTRNQTMWFTYCLTELFEKRQPVTVQEACRYSQRRMRELLRAGNADRTQEPQLFDRALLPIALIP